MVLAGDVGLLEGSEEVDDSGHISLSAYLEETEHLDAKDDLSLMDDLYFFLKKRAVVLEYELYSSLPDIVLLGLDPVQYLPIHLVVVWTLLYLYKGLVEFLWGIAVANIETEDVGQHQYVLNLLDILVNLFRECQGQGGCVSELSFDDLSGLEPGFAVRTLHEADE